jgi:glycosyltransferase involved in cell wall biosynthesis
MKLLAACGVRLLLIDTVDHSVQVVHRPACMLYGISWFPDGTDLCVGHCGFTNDPRTAEEWLDSERGWIDVGARRTDPILSAPHQIHCTNDAILVSNTGRNCLTVFRRDHLYYRHHWFDEVRWDRCVTREEGSHFNSVVVRGSRAYLLAHNFERGSYLLVLRWPELEVLERIPCAAKWAHNIWVQDDGRIIVCDSRYSRLVEIRTGECVWASGAPTAILRGLACRDRHVFVGHSALVEASQRPYADGGIYVLDRHDWSTLDYIALPAVGQVRELRVLEGDECHHGQPLRAPLAANYRATEEYLAQSRGNSTGSSSVGAGRHACLPHAESWGGSGERPLVPPWTTRLGRFRITADGLRATQKTLSLAVLEGIVEADVSLSAHVDVTMAQIGYVGLLARYQGPDDGNAYLAMLFRRDSQFTVDLWKHAGSDWVLVKSVLVAVAAGLLGFQVHGMTLAVYFDGVLVIREEDEELVAAGTAGIRAFGGRIRDFRVERLMSPTAGPVRPAPTRPLRVGMWCDFGSAPTPHSVATFMHRLARGLLQQQSEAVELCIVVARQQARAMADLADQPRSANGVLVPRPQRGHISQIFARWIGKWRQDNAATRVTFQSPAASAAVARRLINRARCDVWIIPHGAFEQAIDFPAVLWRHHACMEPRLGHRFQHAAAAALSVCQSESVRQTELLGRLHVPFDKTRVVPLAPLCERFSHLESPAAVNREQPFLLCPEGFPGDKDARTLHTIIEALASLVANRDDSNLDVVFAGATWPPGVERLAQRHGVRARLKTASSKDLATLGPRAVAVLILGSAGGDSSALHQALAWGAPVVCADRAALRERCAPLGGTMRFFDPNDAVALARCVREVRHDRVAIRRRQQSAADVLWERTWTDVAQDWLALLREAAASPPMASPDVSETALVDPDGPYRVMLFLPCYYAGGVWQAVKNLVVALSDINRERRQLSLTLGVVPNQLTRAAHEVEDRVPVHPVELVRMETSPAAKANVSSSGLRSASPSVSYFETGETTALRAEAWISLADRFEAPLLRVRPLGVFVYDMIQRHAPEGFDEGFMRIQAEGIAPTVRGADRIFVTSPATQQDVREEYGLDAERLQLVPVACEPHRRFSGMQPQPVALPRTPFILNVTNAAPHKGAESMIRALSRLKEQLGADAPLLVLCGWDTDQFSRRCQPFLPYFKRVQTLVVDLGLIEGEDVVFLGQVSDAQLLDLFQRCAAVINSAKHDNGSFSLIEGQYFGKPTVSSDYSAARFLCDRFGVSARFFPIDDHVALASSLRLALAEPTQSDEGLAATRAAMAAPELGYRHYAERIYDALVELGTQGREEANRRPDACDVVEVH